MSTVSKKKIKSSQTRSKREVRVVNKEREREGEERGDSRRAPLERPLALSPEVDDSRTCEEPIPGI